MGNCVGKRNKKTVGDNEDDGEYGQDGVHKGDKKRKGLKDRKRKDKGHPNDGASGVPAGHGSSKSNGATSLEEECKMVKITPLEDDEDTVRRHPTSTESPPDTSLSLSFAGGSHERKVLRLVLPYVPKKEWTKLRTVCKLWCAVVDGEWARMHTIHLDELAPPCHSERRRRVEQGRLLAEHLSDKSQLSRTLVCSPSTNRAGGQPIDLTDQEFWRSLLPRTGDLSAIRLHHVYLPRYFFTDFLPRCKNLETLELIEAPGKVDGWTADDKIMIQSAIDRLDKLSSVQVKLGEPGGSRMDSHDRPITESAHRPSSHNDYYSNSPHTAAAQTGDGSWHQNGHLHSSSNGTTPHYKPKYDHEHIESILNRSTGSQLTSFTHENIPLSPRVLKTLSTCRALNALSFDLNLDMINPYEHDQLIRNSFAGFEHLRDLRINLVTNERNVYQTLQMLVSILHTVAEYSKKLHTLKLIRMPDPMGIDKALATDTSTAFVKLNDETELSNLHVCILAPQERFHPWSLPWTALTRLRTLTLTDCNSYLERPRGIDLESMPNLSRLVLCSDSLDDEMIARVFTQPLPSLVDLTLEPGPRGIGTRGLRTVAVVCQNLLHLTISYGRTRDEAKTDVDSRGWTSFYRAVPDSLRIVKLIDLDRRYVQDVIMPVARQCPQIELGGHNEKPYFDTFADARPIVSNGKHY